MTTFALATHDHLTAQGGQGFARALGGVAAWWRRVADRQVARQMDDHLRADIGLPATAPPQLPAGFWVR